MSGKRYSEEFKVEAVKQVVDRGHPVTQVAARQFIVLDQHLVAGRTAGIDRHLEAGQCLQLPVHWRVARIASAAGHRYPPEAYAVFGHHRIGNQWRLHRAGGVPTTSRRQGAVDRVTQAPAPVASAAS